MKVLITARSFARCTPAVDLLRQQGYEILVNPQDRPLEAAELAKLISGCDALIPGLDMVSEKVITAGLPSLKVIARNGVGYNQVDVAAARRHDVCVTYTPGENGLSVAELVFGLMFSLLRHIPAMHNTVKSGGWKRVPGTELAGKTLGIIGTGCIGTAVARRAAAFDMNLLGFDVVPKPELSEKYGLRYTTPEEIFRTADIISLHAPSTPATRGMVNAATLAMMKPEAYLINTARGDLVVEEDLVAALAKGTIAGAGLDAFRHEPINNPRLLALENVVFTPHAGADTREAVLRTSMCAAREVIRVLSGQTPEHPVPLEKN